MHIDLSTVIASIIAILVFLGLPTATTAFLFRRFEKRMDKREKNREDREEAKKEHELLLIKSVNASIALGEATAQSVQRLDPSCNGAMKKALEYAQEVKHEQKDFLSRQGVCNFL